MRNLANHVQLIGNLGMDPELINLPSGSTLANMSLATNEYRKDKEGNIQQDTQWHRLKAWGKLAEFMADNLKKGARIIISGKIENRNWETDKGEKRRSTEIIVREFTFMNSSNKEGASMQQKADAKDLPF